MPVVRRSCGIGRTKPPPAKPPFERRSVPNDSTPSSPGLEDAQRSYSAAVPFLPDRGLRAGNYSRQEAVSSPPQRLAVASRLRNPALVGLFYSTFLLTKNF